MQTTCSFIEWEPVNSMCSSAHIFSSTAFHFVPPTLPVQPWIHMYKNVFIFVAIIDTALRSISSSAAAAAALPIDFSLNANLVGGRREGGVDDEVTLDGLMAKRNAFKMENALGERQFSTTSSHFISWDIGFSTLHRYPRPSRITLHSCCLLLALTTVADVNFYDTVYWNNCCELKATRFDYTGCWQCRQTYTLHTRKVHAE